MFSKHFILLLLNSYLCLSEQTIVLSVTIVKNEGDPLEISCTGSEGIDFFYPKNISGLAATSPISITKPANGTSKFIFKRPKTVFGDTGYYGCVEANKNQRKLNLQDIYVTPDTYDEIDIKWIYIYVKSETRLLITAPDEKYIGVSIGGDVVLPCRPTSPDYNVTLARHTVTPSPILALSKKLSYDSKVGFTFHDVEQDDQGNYICRVSKPHSYETTIGITISDHSYASTLEINSDILQQFTIGEDFSMNCSITRTENFTHDVFHWATPQKSQPIAKFIKESASFEENVYKSQLTIKNVTKDDVGEYKCYFYGSGVARIAKVNLQLHTKQYLNVTMTHLLPLNGIKEEFGSDFRRSIKVSAYPFPTFKWLDPKGNEVKNDWRARFYANNGEDFFIDLMKTNLTLEDEGNHTLIIANSAKSISATFSIVILVKPVIINKPKDLPVIDALQSDLVEANCEASGKPLPTISWKYTNHLKTLAEISPDDAAFKIKSSSDGDIKTKSTINLIAQRSGKLICRACNEAGCESAVVKMINVPISVELQPNLTPTFKEIALSEGQPLTIVCRSTKKTTFFYPKFDKNVVTSQEYITTPVPGNEQVARFERRRTVYGDSGWYACANIPEKIQGPIKINVPFTPDNYNDSAVQWIYVYVKSSVHLFVDPPFHSQDVKGKYSVYGEVGKDVLLPCRPSSADYNVTLYSNGELINADYDPKKGMMIRKLKADSPLDYSCVIMNSNVINSMDFKIEISDRPNVYEKPIIRTRAPSQMEIGGTFEMDCLVSTWNSDDHILTWVTPPTTDRKSREVITTSSFSEEDVVTGHQYPAYHLTIKNVTAEDFGKYECRYYKYSSVERAQVTLTPHGKTNIKLSMKVPDGGFVIGEGEASILQVDVDAYPIPKFHWYNPKGEELPIPSKFENFEVNGEHFTINLSGYQFTLKDMGRHTFVANNSAGNETITFDVVVYARPSIIGLIPQTRVLKNEEAKFQCSAIGNPVPNITWLYSNGTKGLVQKDFHQDTKTGPRIGEVSSTVTVNVTTAGVISCKVNNLYGEDSFDEDIVFSGKEGGTVDEGSKLPQTGVEGTESKNPDGNDIALSTEPKKPTVKPDDVGLYSLGRVNQEMNTTKGSTITMLCSASNDKFPDDIKWYNTTNLLATDGRVTIRKTEAAPSHSSRLTIKDVNKWDEHNYTCEGTTKDGTAVKNHYQVHVNASAVFSASVILQLSIILLSYFM